MGPEMTAVAATRAAVALPVSEHEVAQLLTGALQPAQRRTLEQRVQNYCADPSTWDSSVKLLADAHASKWLQWLACHALEHVAQNHWSSLTTETRAAITTVIEAFAFSAARRTDAAGISFLIRKAAALRVCVLIAETGGMANNEESERQRMTDWVGKVFSQVQLEPLQALAANPTIADRGSLGDQLLGSVATTNVALLLLHMTLNTFPSTSASGGCYVKGLTVDESSLLRKAMASLVPAMQQHLSDLMASTLALVTQCRGTWYSRHVVDVLQSLLDCERAVLGNFAEEAAACTQQPLVELVLSCIFDCEGRLPCGDTTAAEAAVGCLLEILGWQRTPHQYDQLIATVLERMTLMSSHLYDRILRRHERSAQLESKHDEAGDDAETFILDCIMHILKQTLVRHLSRIEDSPICGKQLEALLMALATVTAECCAHGAHDSHQSWSDLEILRQMLLLWRLVLGHLIDIFQDALEQGLTFGTMTKHKLVGLSEAYKSLVLGLASLMYRFSTDTEDQTSIKIENLDCTMRQGWNESLNDVSEPWPVEINGRGWLGAEMSANAFGLDEHEGASEPDDGEDLAETADLEANMQGSRNLKDEAGWPFSASAREAFSVQCNRIFLLSAELFPRDIFSVEFIHQLGAQLARAVEALDALSPASSSFHHARLVLHAATVQLNILAALSKIQMAQAGCNVTVVPHATVADLCNKALEVHHACLRAYSRFGGDKFIAQHLHHGKSPVIHFLAIAMRLAGQTLRSFVSLVKDGWLGLWFSQLPADGTSPRERVLSLWRTLFALGGALLRADRVWLQVDAISLLDSLLRWGRTFAPSVLPQALSSLPPLSDELCPLARKLLTISKLEAILCQWHEEKEEKGMYDAFRREYATKALKDLLEQLELNFPTVEELGTSHRGSVNGVQFKSFQVQAASCAMLASYRRTCTHSPLARALWKEVSSSSIGSLVTHLEQLLAWRQHASTSDLAGYTGSVKDFNKSIRALLQLVLVQTQAYGRKDVTTDVVVKLCDLYMHRLPVDLCNWWLYSLRQLSVFQSMDILQALPHLTKACFRQIQGGELLEDVFRDALQLNQLLFVLTLLLKHLKALRSVPSCLSQMLTYLGQGIASDGLCDRSLVCVLAALKEVDRSTGLYKTQEFRNLSCDMSAALFDVLNKRTRLNSHDCLIESLYGIASSHDRGVVAFMAEFWPYYASSRFSGLPQEAQQYNTEKAQQMAQEDFPSFSLGVQRFLHDMRKILGT
mmetsp:Transcript_11796/g.43109  ORF Transcript_11796/g.43109 Transcript_11796/m.43109 type:complete len:1241 (-) Transcript_11796:1455-5177(-)